MKIRKYIGQTEKEAMLKVKEELGKEALIVNVKNIKPRGLYKLFKKPYVEVTAAMDEKSVLEERDAQLARQELRAVEKKLSEASLDQKKQEDEALGDYLNRFKSLMDSMNQQKLGTQETLNEELNEVDDNHGQILKVLYDQLLDNEVDEALINQLTAGMSQLLQEEGSVVEDGIALIYKRLFKLVSDFELISPTPGKAVFFIGPTGVGKTTTIAKIASHFALNMNKKVAVITADTYRIAAVEQLRTYANILNIPIHVIYSKEEMKEALEIFKDKDLILVDTAGRSHKNDQQQEELQLLLEEVENKEVYLVLSVATKHKDLRQITARYSYIPDYKIIFTKLDETSAYGNIVNIKAETNAKLSYVTFGQNVPDDMSEVNPHDLARHILGGDC